MGNKPALSAPSDITSLVVTATEREILICLQEHGDNIPANIADRTDRHTKYVTRLCVELEDRGLLANKGRGVYRLTPDGRQLAREVHNQPD